MASKVNVKFVVGVVAVVGVLLAGVMFVMARTVTKSASDHFATAQKFEAEGDWDKAAASYAKAVNKDRKVEYLKKWVNALEHITPSTALVYRERFQKEYMVAQRGLAAAQPTDAAAQKPALDLALFQFKLSGAQPSDWEGFVNQTEEVLREFSSGDKGAQLLRRYRGIARTNLVGLVPTAPADALTKAKDDLEAAVAADPTDPDAMAALGEWYQTAAQKARERRELEKADSLSKEAHQRLGAFVAANKVCLPVLWSLTQMDVAEENQQKNASQLSLSDSLTRHHPKVKRLIEQVLSEPGEKIDRVLAFQVCAMAIGAAYPGVGDEIDRVMTHVLRKRPEDVYLLFHYGELQMNAGKFDKAYETLDKLVKLADRPMSIDGILLFALREEAMLRQGNCALAVAMRERATQEQAARALTDDAAKDAALKKAEEGFKGGLNKVRAIRDQFAERFGKSARLNLLEARIKFFEGDLVEARKLLTVYTNQNQNDTVALKFLADILLRQGEAGAAQIQLDRAIKLNPSDIEAIATLGVTLETLGRFKDAIATYDKALGLDPGNKELIARMEKLRQIDAQSSSDDPVIKVLSQAQEKVTGNPPDVPGAQVLVKKLWQDQSKAKKLDRNQTLAIAQALMLLEDRETAREALKTQDPNDPVVKGLLLTLDNPDLQSARLAAIDQSQVPEITKALLKYQVYRRSSQSDLAKAELEKARAAEPEHPLVLSALFDEALLAKNMEEAKKIAEKAAKINVDKVGGAVFRIRIEQVEGRLSNAAAMAQQVIDADPLSAMGHRLLGSIRIQMRQPVEALASYEKALQINPNDPENIKGKIQALIQQGKIGDALLFARERRAFAANDPEFGQMLLALEGDSGNVEYAIDRYWRQFKRDPNDRGNALELANLLINKVQRWDEVKPVLESIKKQKFDQEAMTLSASWYAGQGKLAEAKGEWETYIQTLPAEKRDALLYVRYSEFLAGNGDFPGARKVLEDNRSLQKPENAEIDRQLGDICVRVPDWQGAIDAYKKALATVTRDENNLLRFRIIESHLHLGEKDPSKFADALKLCDEASAKGIADDLQLVLLRAEATRGMKDYAGAKKLYDRAVSLAPNLGLGFFKRAEFTTSEMMRLQREANAPLPQDQSDRMKKDAADDLEAAIRFDAGFAQARRLLSQLKLSQNDPDGAAKLLSEGIAVEPNNGVLRGDLVQILAAQGKLDEAIAQIEEGKKRSKSADWSIMAGDLLRARADMPRAAENYKAAWDRGVRAPQIARVYAEVLFALPKPDLANIVAIVSDPKIETAKWSALLSMRAKALRQQGKTAESDADIKAAFGVLDQRNPSAVSVFFQDLGEMYPGKAKDMMAAVEALKPADGFTPQFRVQIVRFKMADKDLRVAGIKDLDDLISTPGINVEALYNAMRALADLMYAQRAYDSAGEIYKRILVIKADDFDTMNNYAYTLSRFLGKHEEALPMAQKAVEHFPNSPNVLDTLAVVQLALGRVGESESTLLRAMDLAKLPQQQVPLMMHLAQVALAKTDRVKAQGYLQQAEREIVRDTRLKGLFQTEFDEVKKKVDGGR